MNKAKKTIKIKFAIVLGSALLGFTSHAQPAVEVGISVPLPSVEVGLPSVQIHAESDFYEPLAPQGEWAVVGSYGRVWRPRNVAHDWRPYANGRWEQTDAGWYWASDEPWAWATYHYGRWDYAEQNGWFWVPQTQWAPAWVSWHSGGGLVGWAPLQPSVSLSVGGGFVGFNESRISPHAYVFVKEGGFMNPITPGITVVASTAIIKNTVVINNTRIVNNRVMIGGPSTTVIEKASGHKIQVVQVQTLRHKEEAVVVRERPAVVEKKVSAPVPRAVEHREVRPTVAHEPAQIEKRAPAPPSPGARPEEKRSPEIKESVEPRAAQHPEKQVRPVEKKVQRPVVHERPAAPEKSESNSEEKERENKPKP